MLKDFAKTPVLMGERTSQPRRPPVRGHAKALRVAGFHETAACGKPGFDVRCCVTESEVTESNRNFRLIEVEKFRCPTN